jgi:hypothetical protein
MDGTPSQSAPPFWGIFHSLYVSLMSWESQKFPLRSISLSFFANLIDMISTGMGQGTLPT